MSAPPLPRPGTAEPTSRRFAGRIALVTGSGGGIGRATALRLAREGARLVSADVDGRLAAETLSLAGQDRDGLALALDVRSDEGVATAAAVVADRFGRLDVLVNNAGIEILGRIDETAPAVWDEVMAVNLRGPYLVSRATLPLLFAACAASGGAAVVNNASLMGLVSSRGLAAYCASKAGLVSLTRSMALDHADRNLRVNCVCPGIVHTPMLERRFALEPDRDRAYADTAARPPVGYLGHPDDVAAAIAYLAADEARFVTGTALTIDGGVGAA